MSKNYIFERVYVETPVDTDGDGKYDLISVYIKRPKTTLDGSKVPAIFVANPYLMTCNEDWYVPHNVDQDVKVFPQQNISEDSIKFDFDAPISANITSQRVTQGFAQSNEIAEDITFECISDVYQHFIDRDYGFVFSGGLGTKGSEGFTISGSREEVMAFKAVIDWLNGRCRAFTNLTDNIEIKADWCTGKTAMSAKSYLGTMCLGVATTGVEGLETIIPEAGIVNWYDYYRCNGLNQPAIGWQGDDLDILAKYCFSRAKDPEDYAKVKDDYDKVLESLVQGEDRDSGNYNKFWDERNYLNIIDRIKASVFIIHGINDWNVQTNQCLPLFEALQKHGIERKIMLHQGEHIYIYNLKNSHTLEILDRWLDHYLKGIDTGITSEPKVLIESNIDQSRWHASDVWPPAELEHFEFKSASDDVVTIVDDLSKTVYDKSKDNLKEWLDEIALSDDSYSNGKKYIIDASQVVGDNSQIRVSGAVEVNFTAALDKETAILSAMLVDYGQENRITAEEVTGDDGQFTFGLEKEPSKYKVISRGWLNAQNRTSIFSKEELKPGQFYDYSFKMVPTEYIVKEGHKLGIILYGIDAEATQRPDTVTEIQIKEDSIKIEIPYVKLNN